MAEERAGLLSVLRRPLPWQRDWFHRALDRRDERLRSEQQELRTQLVEARRLADVRSAVFELELQAHQQERQRFRAELIGLRRHVEVRSLLTQLEVADSISAELRKLVEQRAQLAINEARSYADEGLGRLAGSLAATSRALVSTLQRVNDMADVVRRVESVRSELDEAIARAVQVANIRDSDLLVFQARDDQLQQKIKQAISDYNQQLRNVEERLEFVRREMMYEMQAAAFRKAENSQPLMEPRILNSDKVEAMRPHGLRVNIGCGHVQLDDYLNADQRELPGVDVVADASSLPFQPGELAEIRSSHLIEHFSAHILERVLLPYWKSLLAPGGVLITTAPDGDAMLKAVNSGEMTWEDFREVLFGAADYEGDYHFNLLTPKSFSEALAKSGFCKIEEIYSGKRNGKCFEFQIAAYKDDHE